jgi:hypothetical protein
MRRKILEGYGMKCDCCGETTPKFLALDHVDGGRTAERRNLGLSTSTKKYRLLCHNCARGWYGKCLHEN